MRFVNVMICSLQKRRQPSLNEMNYYYNFTNLSLAEKRDHFDSILKFCHNNVSDESSHDETTSVSTPTDLTLRAQDSEGNLLFSVAKATLETALFVRSSVCHTILKAL